MAKQPTTHGISEAEIEVLRKIYDRLCSGEALSAPKRKTMAADLRIVLLNIELLEEAK